ncbi:hypothetical protein CEP54_016347 [Fusarium duplospermum]|uniref:DNA2/NAM7 helicase helicase domain-containing protein n=1 Tax=Fusarium duplospermum TaxID=1325734 RepID=A0A428NES5_9HYPO|nr:hypothetical protein CEP54_016347 [Fusarium duplospermum]
MLWLDVSSAAPYCSHLTNHFDNRYGLLKVNERPAHQHTWQEVDEVSASPVEGIARFHLGVFPKPRWLRICPSRWAMQGEVKAGLSKTTTTEQQDRPAVFDREGAEEALSSAQVVGIESSFLAAYALTTIALGIDTASAAYRSAKRRNVAMSLHSLAVEYFKTNMAQYAALAELVQKAIAGAELDDKDKSYIKACLKDVYADFLRSSDGTVVTTPVAAATTAFRDYFKPDLVIIDEAAAMQEITTLIPIAFFDPKAWIITGDIAQKHPYIYFPEAWSTCWAEILEPIRRATHAVPSCSVLSSQALLVRLFSSTNERLAKLRML